MHVLSDKKSRLVAMLAFAVSLGLGVLACGGQASTADDGGSGGSNSETTSQSTSEGDTDAGTENGDGDNSTSGTGDGDDTTSGDACEDDETKTADDGCNTCACDDGEWLCTEIGCGASCDPADYPQDDGCNSCSCVDGQVVCTDVYCPVLCEEYDTKTADDGCNTCTCAGGLWACTKKACPDSACGARAGDTCSASEYCAYEEGELCGAADAESVCKARPELCPANVATVCGCDGQSYSNDCVAASAGTGVLHDGACDGEE